MILHSHSESHVSHRSHKYNNCFHMALFLLSFRWCSYETNINQWQYAKMNVLTNTVLVLTGNYSIKSEYPVQWIEYSLTNECPNHNIVHHAIKSWIELSLTQSFGLKWWRQTVLMSPISLIKLKNINVKSPQQYVNITYSSTAYRMQSSILFCCTETNNILRAVSSSEDAVFSMRTFTWSWCLSLLGVCRPI